MIAWISLAQSPGWALIISAIGGFAVGMQLMIAVYEDQAGNRQRRSEASQAPRLKIVRSGGGRSRQISPVRATSGLSRC